MDQTEIEQFRAMLLLIEEYVAAIVARETCNTIALRDHARVDMARERIVALAAKAD